MTDSIIAPGLTGMRAPFPPNQISKLPKETGAQAKQRKAAIDAGNWPPKCSVCGGFHHVNAVHLDYVGHAALTDRLLSVDPAWTWEPVADPAGHGFPVVQGGMWIKLTVEGISRYGFGCADGKSGGDAIKEVIGDALRNAAMRFGAALDLWHKGDLHVDDAEEAPPAPRHDPPVAATITDDQRQVLMDLAVSVGVSSPELCKKCQVQTLPELAASKFGAVKGWLEGKRKQLAPANPQHDDILEDEVPF